MEKKITCITCPAGCTMTASLCGGQVNISGNGCDKGKEYGINEFLHPERMVTSLIMNTNGEPVPVKTRVSVPKDRIFDVLRAMRDTVITKSVGIGDVIITDVCGLGVDIVATANIQCIDKYDS